MAVSLLLWASVVLLFVSLSTAEAGNGGVRKQNPLVLAETGLDLLEALDNPDVSEIQVLVDITLPVWNGTIVIDRNVVIKGAKSPVFALVDFNMSEGILQVVGGVTVEFTKLRLAGLYQNLDTNLLAFNSNSAGYVSFENIITHRVACSSSAQEVEKLIGGPLASDATSATGNSLPNYCIPGWSATESDYGDNGCYDEALLVYDYSYTVPDTSNGEGTLLGKLTVKFNYTIVICNVFVGNQCDGLSGKDLAACIARLVLRKKDRPPSPPFPPALPPSPPGPYPIKLVEDTNFDLKAILIPSIVGSTVIAISILLGVFLLRKKRTAILESKLDSRDSDGSGALALHVSDPQLNPASPKPALVKMLTDTHTSAVTSLTNSTGPTSNSMDTTRSVQLFHLLGAGSFGRVYYGVWNSQAVAVKIIPHSEDARAKVKNEVELTMQFNHPNVLRSLHFESFDSVSSGELSGQSSQELGRPLPTMETWIVLEYCSAGSLAGHINSSADTAVRKDRILSHMKGILTIARDIASGMAYLHSVNVCHGDLKCENVLLTNTEDRQVPVRAKVADFGLSRTFGDTASHFSTATVGTVTHMPPELLLTGQLRPSCDVYSFGIILWQLATGATPFASMRYAEIVYKVAVANMRPQFPPETPEPLKHLAEQCWQGAAAQRPTFEAVLEQLDSMLEQADELQAQFAPSKPECSLAATTSHISIDMAQDDLMAKQWAAAAAAALSS